MKAHLTRELKAYVDRVPLTNQYGNVYAITGSVTNNVTQALSGIAYVPSEVEQPVWLGSDPCTVEYLSMRNGLLDVVAASKGHKSPLRGHTPAWFSTVYVPYDFDASAKCPRWLKFLDEALEGDAERIATVQEWFGYCLMGDTRFHKFLIVEGNGENGKSVLLDTLAGLLASANVSRLPLEVFDQRFQLMATFGKLANISPEVENVRVPEATVKQFVGGDVVHVDRKGRDSLEFLPTARLVISTNNRPVIADRSNGMWRRILYVPFRVAVPPEKRDRYLKEKLQQELSGILNWALVGRRRLYEQDGFTESKLAAEVVQQYRAGSNPEREFLMDAYAVGAATEFIPKSDVYTAYKAWAESQNYKPMNASEFAKEVYRAFPSVTTGGLSKRRDRGCSTASHRRRPRMTTTSTYRPTLSQHNA